MFFSTDTLSLFFPRGDCCLEVLLSLNLFNVDQSSLFPPSTGSFRSLQLTLPLDIVVEVDVKEELSILVELITSAIRAQLQAMKQCLQQHHCKVGVTYTHGQSSALLVKQCLEQCCSKICLAHAELSFGRKIMCAATP